MCNDDDAGMAWWNRLTEPERRHWLDRAGSARPADAWAAFKHDPEDVRLPRADPGVVETCTPADIAVGEVEAHLGAILPRDIHDMRWHLTRERPCPTDADRVRRTWVR